MRSGSGLSMSEIRELLGTSRKYAVPLCEYWDKMQFTKRSGDLRLLIVAVTLAVAALTAVGFFADRLKGGLQRDARQLLGGDAVVAPKTDYPSCFQVCLPNQASPA